jgi:hypothetical protein
MPQISPADQGCREGAVSTIRSEFRAVQLFDIHQSYSRVEARDMKCKRDYQTHAPKVQEKGNLIHSHEIRVWMCTLHVAGYFNILSLSIIVQQKRMPKLAYVNPMGSQIHSPA